MKINKLSSNSSINCKSHWKQYNNSVQELHLFLCSFLLSIFTSSTVSVHSSTNLSTTFFCAYNFHDLSHSHSQLLGFQIYHLSHTPLSINYLHSHLHLSSFQHCLLLQTLASNPHLHLNVSCHSNVSCFISSWH